MRKRGLCTRASRHDRQMQVCAELRVMSLPTFVARPSHDKRACTQGANRMRRLAAWMHDDDAGKRKSSSLLTKPSLTSAFSLACAGEPMKRSNGSVCSRTFVKAGAGWSPSRRGNGTAGMSCFRCISKSRHEERMRTTKRRHRSASRQGVQRCLFGLCDSCSADLRGSMACVAGVGPLRLTCRTPVPRLEAPLHDYLSLQCRQLDKDTADDKVPKLWATAVRHHRRRKSVALDLVRMRIGVGSQGAAQGARARKRVSKVSD